MSRTEDPGARSSTDEGFDWGIPIYTTESVLILSTSPDLSNSPQFVEPEPETLARLGGWLFRHRTWLPLPVAVAILTLRIGESPQWPPFVGLGVALTAAGEALRLWGVHHIGAISRTRSDRLGPLVDSGPFAIVRNPQYIVNLWLWVGLGIAARHGWQS